jgi:hypothetical protein
MERFQKTADYFNIGPLCHDMTPLITFWYSAIYLWTRQGRAYYLIGCQQGQLMKDRIEEFLSPYVGQHMRGVAVRMMVSLLNH